MPNIQIWNLRPFTELWITGIETGLFMRDPEARNVQSSISALK